MSDIIDKALASSIDTKAVVIKSGAVKQTGQVFSDLFGDRQAVVVADDRTFEIAGKAVTESLQASGVEVAEPHIFPGDPELYARYENCEALRDALSPLDALVVAVGAGTLNDIAKRASAELERPYLVVGTAASMDGYTAFGSSIALEGFKQTLSGPGPAGCIADLDIMAAAPQVMTASGYGDLLGKVPAGADWIIADHLGIEAIDHDVWDLVQGPLRSALSRPKELAEGDLSATNELAEGLIMSGLSMQGYQSSRPASGAEHQFSHLWEMEGHGVDITPRRLSHGFKVGLGSISIAALYEVLFTRDLRGLDIDAAVAAWPTKEDLEAAVRAAHPDPKLVEPSAEQAMAKYLTHEELRARLEHLSSSWDDLMPRLREQLIPAEQLQQMLRDAGAPVHPSDIQLDWQRFRETYRRAQMIRSRYTVLDVALETGLLPGIVDELFAPDGFWGRQQP